ncbi:hypothetical protein DFH11DRAFT_1879658 [Phellopilus nigrolimitatus]|nr:hypothetical protein DFH11DRAFT_1879658 [Phellopilus nigrolimitatus]
MSPIIAPLSLAIALFARMLQVDAASISGSGSESKARSRGRVNGSGRGRGRRIAGGAIAGIIIAIIVVIFLCFLCACLAMRRRRSSVVPREEPGGNLGPGSAAGPGMGWWSVRPWSLWHVPRKQNERNWCSRPRNGADRDAPWHGCSRCWRCSLRWTAELCSACWTAAQRTGLKNSFYKISRHLIT